jgi:hypothetical protein
VSNLFRCDLQIEDRLTANEIFLNDALQIFRGAGMIPGGIGVNDCDGTTGADAEAVGLGAMNEGLGAAEFEFGEAFFKELPRGHAFVISAAFGLGRSGAEEDVLFVAVEVEGLCGGLQDVVHGRR